MNERVLKLTIRKKWFDLILSGEKVEEYRGIKDFWVSRLTDFDLKYLKQNNIPIEQIIEWVNSDHFDATIPYTHVQFFHGGYCGLQLPNAKFECKGIRIGEPRPEWSDNAQGNHFIIKLGKRVDV
jgi:hypothetical protein